MGEASLFFEYSKWHYGRAYSSALVTGGNFMWFIVHFFSMPLLLRTLFSPWKRIQEEHDKQGLEDYFATIAVNVMTRVFGFCVRIFILFVGLSVLILGAVFILAWFIVWVFLPVLVIMSVIFGIKILLL